jgi:hypothetical protein
MIFYGIGSFLINLSTGMYIGYVLVVDRLPDPTKLKITIRPLSKESVDSFHKKTVMGRMLEMK